MSAADCMWYPEALGQLCPAHGGHQAPDSALRPDFVWQGWVDWSGGGGAWSVRFWNTRFGNWGLRGGVPTQTISRPATGQSLYRFLEVHLRTSARKKAALMPLRKSPWPW